MNIVNNLNAVQTIANALSDLNKKVVFVGGAVVSLYSNDPAADDVRETDDVDITLEIASLVELEMIRELLTKKGFTQSADDTVMCRFHYKGIVVDVMSTEEMGWAPGNPWFKSGFLHLEQKQVGEIKINTLPLSYFLATKFSAYHDRGGNDPRASHDFEDIAYILDNRTDLVEEILNSAKDVQSYLKGEFKAIIENKLMQEAILGNLPYQVQIERYNIIIEKLIKVVFDTEGIE
jgi:predicted nucleotidyltransferase